MQWQDVREHYPDQWLLIEALEAHTTPDQQRLLDQIAVIERCVEGGAALRCYREMHRCHPEREFYFVHTSRIALDIRERRWHGIRGHHAPGSWT